ncbi:ComF family protein [Methanoculleus sp. FWC-SCC1]|uniref:ComF family protein n=1 Tax=Methanoculleus frigidifontis TaxID=2584085 RepID=A0ABT8M880_9EURY|nr:ComF family protein [Methanoculleus sp. FWC-SCC1]MDN7024109.1 ComF family protein [Methanoculleus sp. FWC-SCC1]
MERIFIRSDDTGLEILYPPYCEICGNPIPDSFADTFPYCAACRNRPDRDDPPVRIRAFGKYLYENEFPGDTLSNEIRGLKTDQRFVPRLCECLYYAIERQYPDLRDLDVVIPVMRGSDDRAYNPSALLAEGVASRYGIPYLDVLYKSKVYRSLHSIHDHREKEKEIAGNVGCRYRFNGESVLLIDDTCITGATKRECATVLQAHGAGEVWSLVLGRLVNRKHLETLRNYNE